MGGELQAIDRDAAESLIDWWIDAGVDVAVGESPRDWLRQNQSSPPAAVTPQANVAEPRPETLAELRDWLASSVKIPLASATARRILPHGPQNAAVMLLSYAPALEDLAGSHQIGGEAWQLAVKMLAAIGIEAEQAYSASLSCIHSPGSRMSEKDRAECA